jgi:DNA polymerase-3 subunit beta
MPARSGVPFYINKEIIMKIITKQQDLSRGLSVVSHAVSSRSTLPILANILLSTDNGRLKLSATNLEIGINCWVEGEIIEEGTTTVPAKTLSDLIGSLKQGQVELGVPEDSHTISIKGQGSNSTIKGMDPSEYPVIPGTSNLDNAEQSIVFEAATLSVMIEQVALAAAQDDSRPVFAGVHVEIANEQVTFAAADAFRLAVRSGRIAPGTPDRDAVLIPAKTLSELARILPSDGRVDMIVVNNRSQVLFHTEHIDLVSRLIEGAFPNFRQIIPQEHSTRVVVETKEFAAAVKTVVPFARDSSNIARVTVKPGADESEQGTLTIEATAEDVGSNVSTIAAAVDGPEQQIIFNVKYLSEVLSVLETPEVALELVSAARPGVIKPVGGGDYTYVIMPMSVNR